LYPRVDQILLKLPTLYKSLSRPDLDLRMRPSLSHYATFCNMLFLLSPGFVSSMTNHQAGKLYIFGSPRRLLQYMRGYNTCRFRHSHLGPAILYWERTPEMSKQLSVVVKTHVLRGMSCRETRSWGS